MGLTVTRETRFGELPQDIKQKIIRIYKNSYQQHASAEPLKLTKFSYLYSLTQDLQTRNLQRNFNMIAENASRLKRIWSSNKDVDFKYLESRVKEAFEGLKEDVVLYKKNEGNREFLDEMVVTYGMLENKLESLSREKEFNKA